MGSLLPVLSLIVNSRGKADSSYLVSVLVPMLIADVIVVSVLAILSGFLVAVLAIICVGILLVVCAPYPAGLIRGLLRVVVAFGPDLT